jgi:putative endonuclease
MSESGRRTRSAPSLTAEQAAQWIPAFAGMTEDGGWDDSIQWTWYGAARMKLDSVPTVYILASKPYGTLYVGVTSELCSRIAAHREGLVPGFTKSHGVTLLVWRGHFETMEAAIRREKQIKEWKRDWKINLIERDNPRWTDLSIELCGPQALPTPEQLAKIFPKNI